MMTPKNLKKIVISLLLLVTATMIFQTHSQGSLYPILPIAVIFISLLLMYCFIFTESFSFHQSIGLSVILSIVYRVYIFLFPSGLIGGDPDRLAINIQKIINESNIDNFDVYFYSDAPLYHITGAITAIVGGISAANSLIVYPITLGIVFPLCATILATHMRSENQYSGGAVAGIIAAVATASVNLSYIPIPETLSAILWAGVVIALRKQYHHPNSRGFIILLMFLIPLTYTHKLALPVILFLIVSLSVYRALMYTIFRKDHRSLPNRKLRSLLLLAIFIALITVIQWTYITTYITSVIMRVMLLLHTSTITISPPLATPTAAVAPTSELIGILIRRGYAFVLLPVSGLFWLYLFLKNRQSEEMRFLLMISSLLVIFTAIGFVNRGTVPVTRVLFFTEPILAGLIGIGVVRASSCNRSQSAPVSMFIVIFLVVFLVYSATAIPDFDNQPRKYLNKQEDISKYFSEKFIHGHIYTDFVTAGETPPSLITAYANNNQSVNFTYSDRAFLNGTFASQGYKYILYRKNINIYRTSVGYWKLTWNLGRSLNENYNKVYTNGGASIYEEIVL